MAIYTPTGNPTNQSRGTSPLLRYEFSLIATSIATLAPSASPTFTGTSTFSGPVTFSQGVTFSAAANGINPALSDSSTLFATTAYVQGNLTPYAKINNPTFTGTVTVPAISAGSSGPIAATVDYVNSVALGAATISGIKSQTINTDGTTLTTPNAYPSIYNTAASGANLMILPDARTVPIGFSYELNSSNASNLMTNDGKYLGSANVPAGLVRVWCLSNSTQAGTWAFTPAVTLTSLTASPLIGSSVTVTSSLTSANPQVRSIPLDSTRTLLLYSAAPSASASSGCWGVVATSTYVLGRPTVSVGTPVQISGAANVGVANLGVSVTAALINTNTVAVGWVEQSSTTLTPKCTTISISGTAITVGNIVTLHAAYTGSPSGIYWNGVCIVNHTPGAFVVAYYDPSAKNLLSAVCTVSGTTTTQNGETALVSLSGFGAGAYPSIIGIALSSTSVVFGYGGLTFPYALALTISGTTITPGTPTSISGDTSDSYLWSLAQLTSTTGVYLTGKYVAAFSVSGNTLTFGTGQAVSSGAGVLGVASSSQVMIYTGGTTGYNFNVSGTTLTAGTPATFTTTSQALAGGPYIPAINNGTCLIFPNHVVDISTATVRANIDSNSVWVFNPIASNNWVLSAYITGGTTLIVRAVQPSVSLT
jgi:hypothetical protein